MPNTLADWLIYLESLHPKTIALGLERVAQVKQRLNLDPDFPLIIVGGTNGKGSVCAMLEAILHAAGYKVGCYTSPHLLEYNERVRISRKNVSDVELCTSFEAIELARKGALPGDSPSPTPPLLRGERGQSAESIDIPLTYFEFGTLAAMQCFIAHEVDVAILEVGLGGRLDAVNVFDADVAVVTGVDIDHVDYLGDTREQIAFEKAGIFRPGRVAICADTDVPQALRAHASDTGTELWCLGSEFGFRPHQGQWDYFGKDGGRSALPLPALRGAYQLHNASAVLAALDSLKDKLPVNMQAVRRGLTEVELAGRFQFVPGRPQLILDVAHNPQAARALAQNLANLPPARTFAVFAMLKDKDMAGVVRALDAQIDVWLVAGIDAPRGATSDELARVMAESGIRGEIVVCASLAEALQEASNRAGENDRIAALGSFYTVAEVMRVRGVRDA
ncbi:MAG: bifunctional tetrahydrofolate synthase/dihydrofolate synthase [Sideroxydans sp.]